MKKRLLPFGLFSLVVLSLLGIFFISAGSKVEEAGPDTDGAPSIANAKEYLASIRNNQHTGLLDPKDVIQANHEFEEQASLKSSSPNAFTWTELGPNNMGGRTRGLLFDNRDASGNTIYAGSATGGIFKSVNNGSTWSKVNQNSGTACLNVSCMVQTSSGTIFVGTGEGMNAQNYTAYGQFGYEGGFVGKGLFRGNNNDGFTLVEGTKPTIQGEVTEWAYINDIAIDENNNRLLAATNTGLQYANLPNLDNWTSDIRYKLDSAIITRGISLDSIAVCDSFEIVNGEIELYGSPGWEIEILNDDTLNTQSVFNGYVPFEQTGNCYDVKVSNNGTLYTSIHGKIYTSTNGDPTMLMNRSVYPENSDYIRQDQIEWNTNVEIYDKQGNLLYQGGNTIAETVDWHTDYQYAEVVGLEEYPPSEDGGRTEFAIAPSDQNVAYALIAKESNPNRNSLLGIYLTEDNGQTWRLVAPGGSSSLNILGSEYGAGNTPYYQGDYDAVIKVFPNNPYKILAGGVDLWLGEEVNPDGYFSWTKKSNSDATAVGGIFSPFYCHADHHDYVFKPTNSNRLFVATDGGIYLASISGQTFEFQSLNKNYSVAQFYTLDISTRPNEFIGGAQDIGVVYVGGTQSTGLSGEDLWRPANFSSSFPEGSDGGSVSFTTLRYRDTGGEDIDPPVFYMKGPRPQNQTLINRARRSETLGFDFSLDFLSSDIGDDRFITPMLLWESYNNMNSRDSVTWFADKAYEAGDPIVVRSNNYMHPFNYFLEEAVVEGDSVVVQDIITNKLFIGVEDEIYMSINSADFADAPAWWLISDDNNGGVEGVPSALAYSADANYLWVGTEEGRVFRISNIATAFDENTADVGSPNCIIATDEIVLPGDITQVITSLAVDPADPNKVLVTLGNYGNQSYVFFSNNATADVPQFNNVTGNLPKMPVYSSILEMNPQTNQAVIGTEMGVWATDNAAIGEWYFASPEIGRLPVMAIKQRTFYKSDFTITYFDPATGEPSYEFYPEIENYKDIFVATHGRGVFKYDVNAVGTDENTIGNVNGQDLNLSIYPNPVASRMEVQLNLAERQDVTFYVYDLSGKIVLSERAGNLTSGNQTVELNVGRLTKGNYMLRCVAGPVTQTMKFIVVK